MRKELVHMSSSGLYLTSYDEVFQFPVNPEKLEIGNSASNSSMNVYGVGEATIIQDTKASVINFSSFFPKTYFGGCNYNDIPDPINAVNTIIRMMKSRTPIRFTYTGGLGISQYVTIESFDYYEVGGDVDTIQFSISLKEYREIVMQQITVDVVVKQAKIAVEEPRVDPEPEPDGDMYEVQSGDCLWNIAKNFYGSGARYTDIYDANSDVIESTAQDHGFDSSESGHWIWPGTMLLIPA